MSAHLRDYPIRLQAANILGGQLLLSPYLKNNLIPGAEPSLFVEAGLSL
jgi:hypothetical protein